MYSAYKLNEQGDNKPVSFSISGSNCCFLTYIQISQETGNVVWYSHLFKNFLQFVVIHTVKGFQWNGNRGFSGIPLLSLWSSEYQQFDSDSSAFSKLSLDIWKFSIEVPLKPILNDSEHILTNMGSKHNCLVVWTFLKCLNSVWNLNAGQEATVRTGHGTTD